MHKAYAQVGSVPFSLWAFSGVDWQLKDHRHISAQYGYNPQWRMHAAYIQAFIPLSKHITLNPGYLYLKGKESWVDEHGVMPAVIFTEHIKGIVLEDRNLYWHRVRRSTDDIRFYRNRLRIFHSFNGELLTVKPYCSGEIFYLFNRGRWVRNRIGAGIAFDLLHRFNLDISFNRELDYFNGRSNLVFLMSTISLNHRNKKR